MTQVILATFEDGVLKPTERLDLLPHSRVRLTIELLEQDEEIVSRDEARIALEQVWRTSTLDSRGNDSTASNSMNAVDTNVFLYSIHRAEFT